MKNTFLILLLFSLVGVKCRHSEAGRICYELDEATVNLVLLDAKTGLNYFGGIGVNKVLPNEINMYEEGFKPFLLKKSVNSAGYPWNTRYINDGYVSNTIIIPYVELGGFTRDSVGKQVNRTYYLKIKQDIDTIKINYFMTDNCTMKVLNMDIYYNGYLSYSDNGNNNNNSPQINVYKK
jgi:hypothetical protein